MRKQPVTRRQFLGSGIAAAGAISICGALPANARDWEKYSAGFTRSISGFLPEGPLQPNDEAGWKAIAKNYDVTNMITNLENGYWGIMASPVLAEYQRLTEFINKENTFFARLQWSETYRGVRDAVAGFLNVNADEIALTRGATEALQALIGGYNKLKPGDTVLYADLDYSEMKNAMRWLETRRGVKAVKLAFPEPTKERQLQEHDLLEFYEKALATNPGTKLLLLTHLNNWTGLIIPVAKVAKMAKERGADVILDAAHSGLRFYRRESAQMGRRADRMRRDLYKEGSDGCDRRIHGKTRGAIRHQRAHRYRDTKFRRAHDHSGRHCFSQQDRNRG